MDKNKNLTIDEAFSLAVKNHKKNYIRVAQKLYEKILKINPNHIDALNNLGSIFKELDQIEKAKKCYEKVIEIDPNYLNALNNLGIVFSELGENREAKNCYEKVIEIDPSHIDALNNLGIAFIELGENHKAKSCFEKVININPDYVDALNNLGSIFIKLKENHKAKSCYEKVIEIDPNHTDSNYNLGVVFGKLGENHKAKSFYEKVIEIDPNFLNALNNLGSIFKELDQIEKAKKCYEKVIEIDPNYLSAHNNLGIVFSELEEYQKAIVCFEKVIKIDSDCIDAYKNLGSIFQVLGKYQIAKSYYEKVIEINPKYNNAQYNSYLSNLLKLYEFNYRSENEGASFKKLFLFLFRSNNVYHTSIARNASLLLLSDDKQRQLLGAINSKSSLLKNKIIEKLLKEELFHLILHKSLIADGFMEKLLTKLRFEVLLTLQNPNKDILKKYLDFVISMAEQCWFNEYVYVQSENETTHINKLKIKIELDKEINEFEIVILGCYMALNDSKIIIQKLSGYKSENIFFNNLINTQIKEPLREIELVKSIKSLAEITDTISNKVREQYEKNPYPRWKYDYNRLPVNFCHRLNDDITPNKVLHNNKFNNPNVLIAGCGTGKHVNVVAASYKNSNILAVDLSITSLAYAKRKTEELGYKNIEFLHADILQLRDLNKKFDIVESVGTLHHMKEPIVGFKVLVDLLEPRGFLRLGLYSDTARKGIVEAREYIKEHNLKNTGEDIKICRQLIFNEKESPLLKRLTTHSPDFYSTSGVRDLLFHVQEHRFTIPEIAKILKNLNLEFIGFYFNDHLIKKEYSKLFPSDKKNISLDNWHQFEKNNPSTFSSMYQFWVRKIL